MNKITEMNELQSNIDVLRCEREACSWEQKQRIDRKLDDMECQLDCLRDACS